LALLFVALPAEAQNFNPGGRRRPPRGGRPGVKKRKKKKKKKPSVDKLIARYTGIVLNQPHATFPLMKLTQLHRKRDGNLNKLIADFEKRAATPGADQYNSKLVLAGIYLHAHKKKAAAKLLDQAIKDKPKNATPRLMRARLAEAANDKAAARKQYEAARPLMKRGVERERVTRQLMLLCIDLKDFTAAKKYHHTLVRSAGGSLFVKKEYGRELMNRGHYKRAEVEFRKIVTQSSGDNRALAPALRDHGKVLAKLKRMDDALKVLKRARAIAGRQSGIRSEILALLTDVYREQGKLVELIAILKAEGGRDFQRLATIGALYEETGQVSEALKTYREALKLQSKNIDVRIKLVHLLQTAGQLDEAIKEYRALIKSAPHNADFVFELAETLIQRGERKKALKLVSDLEKRTAAEGDILAAIADFYERIEEQARAIKVLERLAKLPQGDPQHIIDLGDRYFQQGKKDKALATWARIKKMVRNRARAQSMLGDIYLEHDMPTEALAALREAVKLSPKYIRYKKQLAVALERTATSVRGSRYRYREALKMWQQMLKNAGDDANLARECRMHIVGLWAILRQLSDKIGPLKAKLDATPPDLSAGRLLAEVQRRLRKFADAEKTLRTIVSKAPGDEQSLVALERVLIMQRNLDGAIKVLKKLVEVNPKRARQYYQRMAQYSAELYRDDDAIKYASKAVELSPNDATGHYRLGLMYRRRQQADRAMIEFRKAIKKNDRLFRAYFALAELELSSGRVEQADQLYRRVIRTSRDEEFVMRAARASMQINLGKGTLESLERELLPVALGNPQKSIYRRLLVELYGTMTFPLVHAARLGNSAAAKAAREALTKIGARAVKPLLDALASPLESQQRIAIKVLAYVQNKGAGPALFNFAMGQADPSLRVRAMVACGALESSELLPRYEQLLAPQDGAAVGSTGDAVAVAAVWGVARMGDSKAESLLTKLLASSSPYIRALAALGLGLTHNNAHAAVLAKLARSPDTGPTARAAASHALGELGDAAQRPLLLALTDSSELQVQLAALLALARLDTTLAKKASKHTIPADVGEILARTLLSERSELRKTAMAAATALAVGEYRRGSKALPVPDGMVVLADALRALAPTGYTRAEQARALLQLESQLTKAAAAAVATSPERGRIVAELTLSKLGILFDAQPGDKLPAKLASQLDASAEAIAKRCTPGFVALARHPTVEVRKRAIEFLAQRPSADAHSALVSALDQRDPKVCKTALSSLRTLNDDKSVKAVLALLQSAQSWSLRNHAAQALGRIKTVKAKAEIVKALSSAITTDTFAIVRESAMRALLKRDPAAAKPILARVAERDDEPRLRRIATELARNDPAASEPAP